MADVLAGSAQKKAESAVHPQQQNARWHPDQPLTGWQGTYGWQLRLRLHCMQQVTDLGAQQAAATDPPHGVSLMYQTGNISTVRSVPTCVILGPILAALRTQPEGLCIVIIGRLEDGPRCRLFVVGNGIRLLRLGAGMAKQQGTFNAESLTSCC